MSGVAGWAGSVEHCGVIQQVLKSSHSWVVAIVVVVMCIGGLAMGSWSGWESGVVIHWIRYSRL